MKSLTTIPRRTSRLALRANSALGLIPAAITTRSASISSPDDKSQPFHAARFQAAPASAAEASPECPRLSILRSR